MHFMFLILAFMLGIVVWGFFHSNPLGVPRAKLLACNVVILALALAAAFMIVVAVGGLIRNLLLFPISKRAPL